MENTKTEFELNLILMLGALLPSAGAALVLHLHIEREQICLVNIPKILKVGPSASLFHAQIWGVKPLNGSQPQAQVCL